MKILIISGFLGAGKTTFIKELINRSKREIAILENEFGEIGMDKDRLQSEAREGEINIWELAEGCICCSTKKDLAATILTIANAIDPEYLIVEPSGVGLLGNIIDHVRRIEYERIGILAPITIVDGNSYHRYRREFPQMYENQLKYAKRILISKMEGAPPEEIENITAYLRELNQDAQIIGTHYSKMDAAWWEEIFTTGYDGSSIKEEALDMEGLETFSVSDIGKVSVESMILSMENLIRGEFGNIVRAKGSLDAGECRLRFDMADAKYSLILKDAKESPGKTQEEAIKAVFIGRGIQRQKLRRFLFSDSNYIKIRKS
ncbi:MAG: GTP-binding protein [Johnsonella sp.]|nr:GTP-binding protein [Johnsonella sp.]